MKLKPSRLRKAKHQITSITNKTALLSLQKDCNEVFNKKRELSASETINKFSDKRKELHIRLKDLQRQKSLIEAKEILLAKQSSDAHKRVDDQKRSLERTVSELSNKNVQILINLF
jgi:hypothetical protein